MRKAILKTVEELIVENENLIFIGSDLGVGVLGNAKEQFPNRVLVEGISEQNIVGMASGLALNGFKVIVHTISTFLYRRALEQIMIDTALQNLDVCFLGSGAGLVYAPLGPTHQSFEDISILRSIPNLELTFPCDPLHGSLLLKNWVRSGGPNYFRIGKGGEPIIIDKMKQLSESNIYQITEGSNDLAVIVHGAITHELFDTLQKLENIGIRVSSFLVSNLSDIYTKTMLSEIITKYTKFHIIEEHSSRGGIYTAFLEIISEVNLAKSVSNSSLEHAFPHNYGSQRQHWDSNNLSSQHLFNKIKKIVINEI